MAYPTNYQFGMELWRYTPYSSLATGYINRSQCPSHSSKNEERKVWLPLAFATSTSYKVNMTRFYINCDGIDKELFKVVETKNVNDKTCYDLNISFKGLNKTLLLEATAKNFESLLDTTNYDDYKDTDKSSHISVHCNPGKETSTIKRTYQFTNGEKKTLVQVTPGIKRDKLFVPIVFRVCGDMKDEVYRLKNQGHCVNLDVPYTTHNNQLRYMLVLSEKDIEFHYDMEHPSHLKRNNFRNFNLTIIYSFIQVPSPKQAINFNIQTKKEEYENLRGLDWWEVYNEYTLLNSIYNQTYFSKKR